MIDFSFHLSKQPEKGTLLVSDPFLDDDYFRRSVIYLCEHNEEGSFGFVLNNFIEINIAKAGLDFPLENTVFGIGGPVDTGNLYYLHNLGEELSESFPVDDEISIGGNYDELMDILKKDSNPNEKARFFLGYSGWEKGQLDEEIRINSWVVVSDFDKKDIFNTSESDLWKKYLSKLGPKFKAISNFPLDPHQN